MPHVIKGPTPAQMLRRPPILSMWLNDTEGDCVTAEEAFAKACWVPEIFITPDEVQAWATAHGVLNGAVISDVLQWMQSGGFAFKSGNTYRDGPHTSVDWTNEAILRNAIHIGPVKIGVAADQLQTVVEAHPSSGWVAAGFTEDQAEDHCVSLCGFGTMGWLAGQLGTALPAGVDPSAPGYGLFTWSSIGAIDAQSMLAITSEAWLRNPTTVIR
jgi:hypothetical protein